MAMEQVITNDAYWDCNCYTNYIHKKSSGNQCTVCLAHADEQPDSRENEIQEFYHESADRVKLKTVPRLEEQSQEFGQSADYEDE